MCEEVWSRMDSVWKSIIGFGTKPMGSENLTRAAVYLKSVMEDICDEVRICEYPETGWEPLDWELLDGNGDNIHSYLFLQSGPSEYFEGYAEPAGYHRVWDMYVWKRYMIADKDREIKAYVTVRENGEAIPQMVFAQSSLPHYMVGSSDGKRIEQAVKNREVIKGYAHIRKVPDIVCRNIAGTIGTGSKKVIICAHYDTVYSTPGAYDNAAGAAVVLELDARIKNCRLNTKIEFLLTDGEEFDLRGARNQARAERERIEFVLNIDGVGRDDVLEVWSGPADFEQKIRKVLEDSRESFLPVYICPPPPGSDHAPYYDKGIDVCMLTFNDQGILHSPGDVYEKAKLRNMKKMVRIVMELLIAFEIIENEKDER